MTGELSARPSPAEIEEVRRQELTYLAQQLGGEQADSVASAARIDGLLRKAGNPEDPIHRLPYSPETGAPENANNLAPDARRRLEIYGRWLVGSEYRDHALRLGTHIVAILRESDPRTSPIVAATREWVDYLSNG